MKTLNLFAVRGGDGAVIQDGFVTKRAAKEARDKLAKREAIVDKCANAPYFVTFGPDHKWYRERQEFA